VSDSPDDIAPDPELIEQQSERLHSIDMLRGLVIVLMALDHARLAYGYTPFYPTDLTLTTTGFFLTRWVTHFCAPVFVFLAGTGIYLRQQKSGDNGSLSKYLLTRGLWIIFLELAWVNIWFSTAPPWQTGGFFVQVLWVLGVSMIVMSVLIRLPVKWVLVISLILIFGHNAFDTFTIRDAGSWGDWWALLHVRSLITLSAEKSVTLFISYPLIPWIGVMGTGYALGAWMLLPGKDRRRKLLILGAALTLLFVVLRWSNVYGDPSEWMTRREGPGHTVLSFLNTTKYPPSLLFLLMTIGPSLMILAWFESWKGWARRGLEVYGRVPMFFYLIHLPVISITSVYYWSLNLRRGADFMAGVIKLPSGYEPDLALVYIAWIVISVALFPLCYYYGRLKFSSTGRLRAFFSYF
jgi:uncharacterized membrane protein